MSETKQLTVGDAIKLLSKMPQDAPLLLVNHESGTAYVYATEVVECTEDFAKGDVAIG